MARTIFYTLFLIICYSQVFSQSLDEGLLDLTNQISSEMSQVDKKKIAVVELVDLNGNVTELGKYISEELITRLFRTKKYRVVERQLLNKILAENKLQLSGIVDETTAKQIGKILGVDAICTGTITDLIDNIKINSRLIDTESGSIFAVASTLIRKDELVRKLLGQISVISDKNVTSQKISLPGKIFLYEDFSNLEEGTIPIGWIGGEKSLVKKVGKSKCLTNFETTREKITIPANFPENFKLDWVISLGHDHWASLGDLNISVGPGLAGGSQCGYNLEESSIAVPGARTNVTMMLSLEKKGDVFRLFSDGSEILIIRKPNFKIPNAFTLEFNHSYKLFKVVGTDLGF